MNEEKRKEYLKKHKNGTKRVSLTFTNKEFKELEKLAKSYKLNPTTFLKKVYLGTKNNDNILTADTSKELKVLTFLIRNIANNINQIAYSSNIFKFVSEPKRISENLAELERVIKKFINNPRAKNDNKINEPK